MNCYLLVLAIFLQSGALSPPSVERRADGEAAMAELWDNVPVLQMVDVRESNAPPLPALRETIPLPFPKNTEVRIVDSSEPAVQRAFAPQLQRTGELRRIDGFTQGRIIAIGSTPHVGSRFDEVLRHELVHAYLNVVAPERQLPDWLEEGLACYFSKSPSHLNHETYQRYERDIHYLFSLYPERVPNFLVEAILTSNPDEELFEHFQIQGSGELHARQKAWQNAFWLAIFSIPVAAFLLGRLLAEFFHPWYVSMRRNVLSRVYPQKLKAVRASVHEKFSPSEREFITGAREAVEAVRNTPRGVDRFLHFLRPQIDRLWVSAKRLLTAFDGADTETTEKYHSCVDTLSFSRRALLRQGNRFLYGVTQSCNTISSLLSTLPDSGFLSERHGWNEAVRNWKQTMATPSRKNSQYILSIEQLGAWIRTVVDSRPETPSRSEPFLDYAFAVADRLSTFEEGNGTLASLRSELQNLERRLQRQLRGSEAYELTRSSSDASERLDDLIAICFDSRDQSMRDYEKNSAEWAREDSRRESRPVYTHLDLSCFILMSGCLLLVWPHLRSFYQFFLLGLHWFFTA